MNRVVLEMNLWNLTMSLCVFPVNRLDAKYRITHLLFEVKKNASHSWFLLGNSHYNYFALSDIK